MCECQGNPLARVTLVVLGLPYLLVNRALRFPSPIMAPDVGCCLKFKSPNLEQKSHARKARLTEIDN